MIRSPCSFPDRDRLALLDAAGRLEGDDLARWDRHIADCAACAERAAGDARTDAALAELATDDARSGSIPARTVRTIRGGRRWAVLAVAAAAVVAVALGWIASRAPGGEGAAADRRAQYLEAIRLGDLGRREEELAVLRGLLRERRDYPLLFLTGHALLNSGRAGESVAYFREALATDPSPSPDGGTWERWCVAGNLAQALVASASGAEHDAEVERIVREEVPGPGLGPCVSRCLVWTALAQARALGRGDVAGGEAALAEAERENLRHRAASVAAGRPDLDCHYVLHARFAFAEIVRGDSEAGRAAAAAVRAMKDATAPAAASPSQAESYRADGAEFVAIAELLAARRGDAADLALAARVLDGALAARRRAGNPQGLARCLGRLAWLALARGVPGEAIRAAQDAEAEATRSGAPEELLEARLLRAQALLAAGSAPEALAAIDAARSVAGAPIDARRELTLAALEAQAAPAAATREAARARLAAAAARSPLRDVRLVATRVLEALDAGRSASLGPADFGFAP